MFFSFFLLPFLPSVLSESSVVFLLLPPLRVLGESLSLLIPFESFVVFVVNPSLFCEK